MAATSPFATLKLDGKSIKVFDFSFGFVQYTDETGKAAGHPTGGDISLNIEQKPDDTQIINWMLSPSGQKNGSIEVVGSDAKTRTIKFTNALCISYNESFNHLGGEQPLSVSITISAETIKVEEEEFKQKRKTK